MIDLEQIRGLSFTMDEHGHRYMIDLIGELCDEIERLHAQRAIETDDVKKAHAMGFEDGVLQEREDVVAWLRAKAIKDENGGIPWDDCELRLCANAIERGEHLKERT
jgi:hypothetical protein